jgi:phosphatidylglycerol lysyltransferase
MDGHGGGSAPSDPELERALALLKRFGWNATSFQCLEPGFRYWFDPTGDGFVAYVDTGSAWVAGGAPIADAAHLALVADRFVAVARTERRRVAFFAIERRFLEATEYPAISIGEQPVWDPSRWDETLAASRGLREQCRRARAKSVTVRMVGPDELTPPTAPARRGVDRLIDRWAARHRLPPMGFLVQVYPYSFPAERRFFAAERDGVLVGFLAMVPVYARGGWLIEDLLRDPSAPNGTAELLVDRAMRAANDLGSRYATLGLAPLAGRVSGWLQAAARLAAGWYNFKGVRAFKARLRPLRWEPIYVARPVGQGELATVLDILSAFAHGRLLRFGLKSLLRTPEIGIRALTILLVPWTALLGLAAPARWFPSPAVQLGWTAFDLVLLGGLAALWRRPRAWLASLLAALVSADAILTVTEVLTFNARRGPSALEWVVLAGAMAGPTAAAIFLAVAARQIGVSARQAADRSPPVTIG